MNWSPSRSRTLTPHTATPVKSAIRVSQFRNPQSAIRNRLQFGNPRLNGIVDEVGLLVEVQLGHHAIPVGVDGVGGQIQQGGDFLVAVAFGDERSEERRVGKECRSRW